MATNVRLTPQAKTRQEVHDLIKLLTRLAQKANAGELTGEQITHLELCINMTGYTLLHSPHRPGGRFVVGRTPRDLPAAEPGPNYINQE